MKALRFHSTHHGSGLPRVLDDGGREGAVKLHFAFALGEEKGRMKEE